MNSPAGSELDLEIENGGGVEPLSYGPYVSLQVFLLCAALLSNTFPRKSTCFERVCVLLV